MLKLSRHYRQEWTSKEITVVLSLHQETKYSTIDNVANIKVFKLRLGADNPDNKDDAVSKDTTKSAPRNICITWLNSQIHESVL